MLPILLYTFFFGSFSLGAIFLFLMFANQKIDTSIHKDEKFFYDPNTGTKQQFPEVFENYESLKNKVTLSVIAPAYNEENRIHAFMKETVTYLKNRVKQDKQFSYEIIIVDDGSTDNTASVALDYVKKEGVDTLRFLKLQKNRGKGGAVRRGMMIARGKYLLMADSDAATKFSDIEKLEECLSKIDKDGFGVVVGSRKHLMEEAVAKRTFFRNLLMWGFHFMVNTLCVRGIRDTQCGFKLFTRKAAQTLFMNLHIEKWAFDVELLYLAQKFGIPIAEVSVNWTEVPGSHLNPFGSSVQMGKDLVRIRLNYLFGLWKATKLN
eukprot:TRINITY_DN1987_c0_g1_i1.p1 TRINITY_DN1987_c0_g1~~TRINITY_DN1987_c0_g1_i1.p1  ORF type:complete len:321 (+),score=44.24 TRINITY_DN1987_c0_g1_i1:108-1070(+)